MEAKSNYTITRSTQYKTLKLFLIGNGEGGKTTLLYRLKNLPHEKVSRTTGIDIEDWYYPEVSKGILKRATKDAAAHFVVWDCAWQEVYQCFYSKRSLFLALFRLTDGPSGVDELDPWLRNVQFRAPGCPVIVIGTHLDAVTEQKATELEKLVQSKYQDTRIYPKVVAVVSVSCDLSFSKTIDRLRRLIFEVSCHLQLSSDGTSLEYKRTTSEDDPRGLFQEQIPLSFLELQKAIKKEVTSRSVTGSPPVMMEEEFKKSFSNICEDDDEFQKAVNYLRLQGTLLHFEDVALRGVVFLDPQWLTKLVASIINNMQLHSKHGIVEATKLFDGLVVLPDLQDKCVKLLEKFEVALVVQQRYLIVPSMVHPNPPSVVLTSDSISLGPGSPPNCHESYHPPLRRFWLSAFVPKDYWHHLFGRVAMDSYIDRLLPRNDVTGGGRDEGGEGFNWLFWATGMAYVWRGRTLLVIKQQINEEALHGEEVRIEVHVHTPWWVALSNEVQGRDPGHTLSLATHLLVMVSHHVVSLALGWFPGMLLGHPTPSAYVPCWKCYEAVDCTTITEGNPPPAGDDFIYHNQTMVHCFDVDQCVPPAVLGRELMCVFHNGLQVRDMVPDLIFWDLQYTEKASNSVLKIAENDILDKGIDSIICKGELTVNDRKQNVAVKIFMDNMDKLLEIKSVRDILKESREPEHLLYAYHQIRQEVSFLSNLSHPNLTELCGVKTQPLCLLLELAPKRSLRAILKEYKERGQALEPLSLKVTAKQIADALEYLHDRQIVHLDVKSPNVLVWHFPLATLGRQERMGQAGNILLKLADYGISQVSTRRTIRVANNPVGTPGFIAPEMFGTGKEVSADKLDVFAFGMTIYELLSYKAPFETIEPLKRTHLVKDGQRPSLMGKELRSPLLLQELMVQCWSQNPDDRPQMRDVGRWVSSPEFERLRAQVYLKDVKTLSCACVCRITPEQASTGDIISGTSPQQSDFPVPDSTAGHVAFLPSIQTLDEMECVQGTPFEEQGSASPTSSPLLAHTASGTSLYSMKTSTTSLQPSASPTSSPLLAHTASGTSLYSMKTSTTSLQPSASPTSSPLLAHTASGTSLYSMKTSTTSLQPSASPTSSPLLAHTAIGTSLYSMKTSTTSLQPSASPTSSPILSHTASGTTLYSSRTSGASQVWLCGRARGKGWVGVFTYPDHPVSVSMFTGYLSKEDAFAMCPVRNTMWVGTTTGKLRMYHAPTLKCEYVGQLTSDKASILDMVHIKEVSAVMVTTSKGDVWVFHDQLCPQGLLIEEQLCLGEELTIYHLAKVVIQGRLEVWGSTGKGCLVVLDKTGGSWNTQELACDPRNDKLKLLAFVVHCEFVGSDGRSRNHIWTSYRSRAVMVSWDAQTRRQRNTFDCALLFKSGTSEPASQPKDTECSSNILSLAGQGRKVFVGTSGGSVGVVDSETCAVLKVFAWHQGKVRTLLVMPREVEGCLCAEVPIMDQGEQTSANRRAPGDPQPVENDSVASLLSDNPLFVPNLEPDACMVTSIGNGRRQFVKAGVEHCEPSANGSREHSNDMFLQTWKS